MSDPIEQLGEAAIKATLDESGIKPKIKGFIDGLRNKTAFARTTSTDYTVRFFYFAFSVMLYNAWNSVKYLLVLEADLGTIKKKLITLLSFIQELYSMEIT